MFVSVRADCAKSTRWQKWHLTLIVSRELIITWVTSNVRAFGPNYRSDVVESTKVEYKSASLAVGYKNRKQQFLAHVKL